ncbi:MAG: adenylate/guanylate cyclase domain-containing protein [Victivallales bacterium]|nr:adenylate/guanylate cyclase domain-containing protein [Victivallales bacterium]
MQNDIKKVVVNTVSLTIPLSLMISCLTLLVSVSIGINGYLNSKNIVNTLSHKAYERSFGKIQEEIQIFFAEAQRVLSLNKIQVMDSMHNNDEFSKTGDYLSRVAISYPRFTYATFGDKHGRAVWAWNKLPGKVILQEFDGATESTYKVGSDGKRLGPPIRLPNTYDPRVRPWYKLAAKSNGPVISDPYLFVSDYPRLGISYSLAVRPNSEKDEVTGVLSIDFSLEFLSDYLRRLNIEDGHGRVVLLDDLGALIAHQNPELIVDKGKLAPKRIMVAQSSDPLVRVLGSKLDEIKATTTLLQWEIEIEGKVYRILAAPIKISTSTTWYMAIFVPEAILLKEIHKSNLITIGVSGVLFIISLSLAWLCARFFCKSLNPIFQEISRIENFDLDDRPTPPSRITEIATLKHSLDSMRLGLRSFQRYVPADLVRKLISEGIDAKIGGKRVVATVLFTDIKDFTSISESMTPQELFEQLSVYLDRSSKYILLNSGTLDKFIGDAVMAFWNAPSPIEDHAFLACKAAIEMRYALNKLAEECRKEKKPVMYTRFGLNTGELIVGNMGASERLNYSCIGDTVNLAARLEQINKYYKTDILIGQNTYNAVKGRITARIVDRVAVKGKKEGVLIYELIGFENETDEAHRLLIELYGEAFELYQTQDWTGAIKALSRVLKDFPEDGPSKILMERCVVYSKNPPVDHWDGIYFAISK